MEFLHGAYGRINYFNHSGKPLGLSTKSDHVPTLRPSNSIPSFKRPYIKNNINATTEISYVDHMSQVWAWTNWDWGERETESYSSDKGLF